MSTTRDLTGSQQEIDAILARAKEHPDVEHFSKPMSLDAGQALNFGLPDVDPETALMFITLVFKAGKSGLDFFKALRDEYKERDSAVAVSESASGDSLGRIEASTSDEMLKKIASS